MCRCTEQETRLILLHASETTTRNYHLLDLIVQQLRGRVFYTIFLLTIRLCRGKNSNATLLAANLLATMMLQCSTESPVHLVLTVGLTALLSLKQPLTNVAIIQSRRTALLP
jgi:hypothetical protein